jgi:hypothetical protein
MSRLGFDEAVKELKGWTQALLTTIDDSTAEAKAVLTGDNPNPAGAPSRESMARLVIGQIGKKLREVNGLYEELTEAVKDPRFGSDD